MLGTAHCLLKSCHEPLAPSEPGTPSGARRRFWLERVDSVVADDISGGSDSLDVGAIASRLDEACSNVEMLVDALEGFLGGNTGSDSLGAGVGDGTPTVALGDGFWSELVRALCHDCLLASWGSAVRASSLNALGLEALGQQAVERMAQMDARLRRAGLARHASCAAFAAELGLHATRERAQVLLCEARRLLRESPAEKPELLGGPADAEGHPAAARGLPPLGDLPRCRVSTRAVGLARLLGSAMEYASSCDARSATVIYRRARDLVELFAAVAVGRAALEPPIVPHATLLLSDDCTLLAHCCLSLGAAWVPRLPSPLREAGISFTDFVPMLRARAEELLDAVFCAQRDELLDAVAQGGSFEGVGENEEAERAARAALRRLSHQLRALPASWAHTVPWGVGLARLRDLVDAPLAALLRRLLALRHISEQDGTVLQALLQDLCAAVDSLFASAHTTALETGLAAAPSVTDASLDANHETAFGVTPCLRKCQQLEWLLGARLPQLEERYHAGQLDAFSAREVLHVVCAVYDEGALQADHGAQQLLLSLKADVERTGGDHR